MIPSAHTISASDLFISFLQAVPEASRKRICADPETYALHFKHFSQLIATDYTLTDRDYTAVNSVYTA